MRSLLALGILFTASAHATTNSGGFTALSFNVAGLPQILQSNDVNGSKTENAGEIGTYFAKYGYDIIHMQEVNMFPWDILGMRGLTLPSGLQLPCVYLRH